VLSAPVSGDLGELRDAVHVAKDLLARV
jgi:hypothetical protein